MKKCKECLIEKELEFFYKHPQGVMGTLPRCKECIKKGRKSERERIMARKVDKKRIRPDGYIYNKTKEYREKNPEKYYAHRKIRSFLIKNKQKYSFKCCICGKSDKIELHHEDYNKPNEVVPFCPIHHRGYHFGKNGIDLKFKITFPF